MQKNGSFKEKRINNNDKNLYIEILTNFIYKIQDKLDVNFTDSEKYSFISVDKMGLKQLQNRLNKIEEKINLLVDLQTKNNVNDLLIQVKEDNAMIEKEIEKIKINK